MHVRTVIGILLCVGLWANSITIRAFETDQYDLPPTPLVDIGDEVSEHVQQKLRQAVEKINAQITETQKCLSETEGSCVASEITPRQPQDAQAKRCSSKQAERAKLEYLQSSDAVVRATFEQLGAGVPPFTSMGTWMDSHHFRAQPARYRTSYLKSIFILLPHIALTISPTVKMYGPEFGTDKIAHFFQQGYSYYKIYRRAQAAGATPQEAARKAIRWGQRSEDTYYGTLIAGVYSNGDLGSNYVGMKFYQGLTQEIRIGEQIRPAVLVLKSGLWTFNSEFNPRESLLKPFISDHLNEALNPSIFTKNFGLRWYIRREVKRRSCNQWFERYPSLSRDALEEKSRALRLWHGEDYGFTDSEHFVTIANTCFSDR